MKKIVSILLVVSMVLCMSLPTFAERLYNYEDVTAYVAFDPAPSDETGEEAQNYKAYILSDNVIQEASGLESTFNKFQYEYIGMKMFLNVFGTPVYKFSYNEELNQYVGELEGEKATDNIVHSLAIVLYESEEDCYFKVLSNTATNTFNFDSRIKDYSTEWSSPIDGELQLMLNRETYSYNTYVDVYSDGSYQKLVRRNDEDDFNLFYEYYKPVDNTLAINGEYINEYDEYGRIVIQRMHDGLILVTYDSDDYNSNYHYSYIQIDENGIDNEIQKYYYMATESEDGDISFLYIYDDEDNPVLVQKIVDSGSNIKTYELIDDNDTELTLVKEITQENFDEYKRTTTKELDRETNEMCATSIVDLYYIIEFNTYYAKYVEYEYELGEENPSTITTTLYGYSSGKFFTDEIIEKYEDGELVENYKVRTYTTYHSFGYVETHELENYLDTEISEEPAEITYVFYGYTVGGETDYTDFRSLEEAICYKPQNESADNPTYYIVLDDIEEDFTVSSDRYVIVFEFYCSISGVNGLTQVNSITYVSSGFLFEEYKKNVIEGLYDYENFGNVVENYIDIVNETEYNPYLSYEENVELLSDLKKDFTRDLKRAKLAAMEEDAELLKLEVNEMIEDGSFLSDLKDVVNFLSEKLGKVVTFDWSKLWIFFKSIVGNIFG